MNMTLLQILNLCSMKKLSGFLAAMALILAVSCSPSIFRMDLQMRQPSSSGYDFGGKEMAVVYLAPTRDTSFLRALAEGFATSLEEDYFGGNQVVGVYSMPIAKVADYSSRDTLLNIVMDTEKDVIFLFEGQPDVNDKVKVRLHVYDSMGKTDTVRTFSAILPTDGGNESAKTTGQKASVRFLSNWRPESFYFYYYDYKDWCSAADDAYEFKWYSALEKWLSIATKVQGKKLACAAYNLASASYILGDYSLCDRWLSVAEQNGGDELTAHLRVKLMNKLGGN